MLQHIAGNTSQLNRVAKRMQHVVPNNVARCCVEVFGQALKLCLCNMCELRYAYAYVYAYVAV